ncbi:MAG: hypothetical protein DI598_15210, partial [Pseudopedobacter saltans]
WPKRPSNLPSEKNQDGVYIDRIPTIKDTIVSEKNHIYSFEKIAGDNIKSLPLYTTEHSNEEHFLTTIHFSFHIEDRQAYLDLLSLDNDFPLKNNNQFSLLFVNGKQWDFVFSKDQQDGYAASIPLTKEQLSFLAKNKIDKWRLRRDKDDYFTVGAFNFEVKKYVYKPEIQATIQTMAEKLLPFTF